VGGGPCKWRLLDGIMTCNTGDACPVRPWLCSRVLQFGHGQQLQQHTRYCCCCCGDGAAAAAAVVVGVLLLQVVLGEQPCSPANLSLAL
jgi:hypothetical protein